MAFFLIEEGFEQLNATTPSFFFINISLSPPYKEIPASSLDIPVIYGYNVRDFASVAQSVVHLTRNEKVACSSQVTSSKNPTSIEVGFLLFHSSLLKTT